MIKRFISLGIVCLLIAGTVACDKAEETETKEVTSDVASAESVVTESLDSKPVTDGSSMESSNETHTVTETGTATETEKYEQIQTLNGVPIEDYEIVCQSES